MLLDRHRVARLVELSALERTLKGPERLLRENDVAVLVKAAYDDANDEARAAFMARVQSMPTSAWPWSAVQATAPRGGGGGGLGSIVAVPKPVTPTTPAALILIRGQAESADADPGNRLPDRGSPEALEWEPLHKALDAWDTQTILKSIGAQSWISMIGTSAGDVPKDTGSTSGAPAGNGGAPAGANGTGGSNGKAPTGTTNGQGDLPAPQPSPTALSWRHPAVIAAGATVVVVGGFALYALGQDRRRSRLEEALGQQEELP